jgi:hypothetical protein
MARQPSITANMHAVLTETRRRQEGLRRLFDDVPGKPPWPANPSTLAALVRHGLVERSENRTRRGALVIIWRITDAGREALQPPQIVKPDKPLFLARGSVRYRKLPDNRWAVDETGSTGDYTSDPGRSIDNDSHPTTDRISAVEVLVTPTDMAQYTREAREREHARLREKGRTLDSHPIGDRLQRLRLIACGREVDIHGEQRLIRHMLSQGRETAALARVAQLEAQFGQRAA